MLYEPRMETANSFKELRETLKHRGFSSIPMGMSSLLDLKAYKQAPIVENSSIKVTKTMIRKHK